MTLQNRITTLMIGFSVLLISAFTVIQLNNQINSMNRYNSYQANLSANIVKNNLETIIKEVPSQKITEYIQKNLEELKESGIIKEALVYNLEGKIIASTKDFLIGEDITYKDLTKIEELRNSTKENIWFISQIDNINRLIEIYLPLESPSMKSFSYVAKLIFSLADIREVFLQVYRPLIIMTVLIVLINILFGLLLSKTVVGPIKVLNNVTKIIAQGNLTVRTHIYTHDELQELGETFNYMTEELIKMKERAENANPLTKLPGNIVIREEIEKRINNDQKFTVIYCDLDNFKAFNDKYGIAKGDEAIKLTAEIFKEAIRDKGNPEDFIGHEGGDDFILVTTPEKAEGIANYIIAEFDKRVRLLYDQEDLNKGFIVSTARDGSIKQFPIMSISLMGVTNAHRLISKYMQVTNIAADLKKKAKATPGSIFVLDKRKE